MIKYTINILVFMAMASVISLAFAERGYVGLNPVSEVFSVGSSAYCGPNSGRCLLIYFEGGALGCSPSSNHISIRESNPDYKDFKAYALLSLSTGKKFRTYASREYCADADNIGANGASVYDVPH